MEIWYHSSILDKVEFFVIKIKTKYKAYELEIHVFPLEVIFL